MIPAYYEFFNPVKIISGNKAVDNIPYELEQLGASRPLILTDQGVEQAGLLKIVEDGFKDSQAAVGAVYDQVPPDSSNQVVNEVVRIYRENECDSIIAVGGGSVIDTAKGVNIVVTEGSDDLMKFIGAEMLKKPMKPFIVVPTTAGTGSEVTLVAVIYNVEKQVKMAFTSYHLLPKVAVLDPRMTLSLPPHITAATGMDALTHAMEAYYCLQKNPMSDAYALAAIDLIRQNLVRAVEKGKEKKARLAMANAACMAGIAFSNAMVGMVHSLGHACGSVCHLPHGTAMSIFLPYGLEYNLELKGKEIGELLLPLGGPDLYARTPQDKRPEKTIELVFELREKLYQLCRLPRTLKEAGIAEDKLGKIARAAINDPSIIFNPAELEYDEALQVLKKAYA